MAEKGFGGKSAAQVQREQESDLQKRFELEMQYGLREPKQTLLTVFADDLPDDEKPFAQKLFQMDCNHFDSEVTVQKSENGISVPERKQCKRCGLSYRVNRTATLTKRAEWDSYCPDGFDMFDWQDLYQRDKSTWRFIFSEVLSEMEPTLMEGE